MIDICQTKGDASWMEKARRVIATVQLSDAAADALDFLASDTRLNKKLILECVLCWVASQSDVIRGDVLQTSPRSARRDLARMVLEKMANPPTAAETADDAAVAAEVQAAAARAVGPIARAVSAEPPRVRRAGGAA